jgi:hypothetical protein
MSTRLVPLEARGFEKVHECWTILQLRSSRDAFLAECLHNPDVVSGSVCLDRSSLPCEAIALNLPFAADSEIRECLCHGSTMELQAGKMNTYSTE